MWVPGDRAKRANVTGEILSYCGESLNHALCCSQALMLHEVPVSEGSLLGS